MIPLGVLAGQVKPAFNYVVNGDFASSTGWTLGSGWSISGGKAVASSAGAGSTLQTTAADTMTTGTYRVTFTVSNYTGSGAVAPRVANTTGTKRNANGTYVEDIVVASVDNQFIQFVSSGLTALNASLDDISVIKIA